MQGESDKCYACRELQRFYTKGTTKFNQTKYGRCCNSDKIVYIHESCECFVRKPRIKKRRKYMLELCLNDLLTEISKIRKILEAENEREDVQ